MGSCGSSWILPSSSWRSSLRLWRLRDGPRHAEDIPIMALIESKKAKERRERHAIDDGQTISKIFHGECVEVRCRSSFPSEVIRCRILRVGCFADGQSHHLSFLGRHSIRSRRSRGCWRGCACRSTAQEKIPPQNSLNRGDGPIALCLALLDPPGIFCLYLKTPAHLVCGRAASAPAWSRRSRRIVESSPAPTDSDPCKLADTIHTFDFF